MQTRQKLRKLDLFILFGLLGILLASCGDQPEQNAPTGQHEANIRVDIETEPSDAVTLNPLPTLGATEESLPAPEPKDPGGTTTPIVETPPAITPGLEIPVTSFSPTSIGRAAPQDVLEELAFFTGGGGMGCLKESHDHPEIVLADERLELHDFAVIQSCGWDLGEQVGITVLDSKGNQSQAATKILQWIEGAFLQSEWTEGNTDVVDSNGGVNFGLKTDVLKDIPGIYTVLLTGSNGTTLTHIIDMAIPQEAKLYWNDDDSLLLYNFSPGEDVRLFAYSGPTGVDETGRPAYELYAWQQFVVSQDGVLLVNPGLDARIGWYAAIGAESGEVGPQYPSSPRLFGVSTPTIVPRAENNGDIIVVSEPTSEGEVTTTSACGINANENLPVGDNARVWSEPNVDSGVSIASLPLNQVVTIVSGPVWGKIRRDVDISGWWWEVDTGDIRGWVWEERIRKCAE